MRITLLAWLTSGVVLLGTVVGFAGVLDERHIGGILHFHVPPLKNASLLFVPDGSHYAPATLANIFGRNDQERAAEVKVFGDALTLFEQQRAKLGLPANDLSVAALAVVRSHLPLVGGSPLTDGQSKSVLATLREGMLADRWFQGLSNRDRQEAYEGAAIYSLIVPAGLRAATQSNNAESVKFFQGVARQNLEFLLGPLDRIHLTPAGIEPLP